MNRRRRLSPSYWSDEVDLTNVEDRIKIYDDRVRGWLLTHARSLVAQPSSDFAVLQLLMSYFESYEMHRTGRDSHRNSQRFFERGFKDVFQGSLVSDPPGLPTPSGLMNRLADALYKEARCGLFHDGVARFRIGTHRGNPHPIALLVERTQAIIGRIFIEPERFLTGVEQHHAAYVARLRDPKNTKARQNFSRGWDIVHSPTRGGLDLRALLHLRPRS
jgi:hypothetical protein